MKLSLRFPRSTAWETCKCSNIIYKWDVFLMSNLARQYTQQLKQVDDALSAGYLPLSDVENTTLAIF